MPWMHRATGKKKICNKDNFPDLFQLSGKYQESSPWAEHAWDRPQNGGRGYPAGSLPHLTRWEHACSCASLSLGSPSPTGSSACTPVLSCAEGLVIFFLGPGSSG